MSEEAEALAEALARLNARAGNLRDVFSALRPRDTEPALTITDVLVAFDQHPAPPEE